MPRVLTRETDGDTLRLRCQVDDSLQWFRGHFPGFAVLPGVVQLHWAVTFAREHFGLEGSPRDVQRLKFKKVVIPPATMQLTLSRIGPFDVSFLFEGDGSQYSEGRLRFPGGGR